MKCPKCQLENPADARFCNECGGELETACPACGKTNPPGSKFCNGCGRNLKEPSAPLLDLPHTHSDTPELPAEKMPTIPSTMEGERKHVTVLFSDLSGYTAMAEKLDPEEVKEIMSRVFGEIAQVVA